MPVFQVYDLTKQASVIGELKRFGSKIRFTRPTDCKEYTLSVLVFSDGGQRTVSAQPSVVSGLLVGQLSDVSVLHTIPWLSHKSKLPVRSIAAGEILTADESIDQCVIIKRT